MGNMTEKEMTDNMCQNVVGIIFREKSGKIGTEEKKQYKLF